MTSAPLFSATGESTGTVDLDEAIFAAPINVPAMHQVVTAQLAAARRGTSKTKSRGEVRGGGRKPWRQKGTGRARQGSIRSPQWAGGGVAHGPDGRENYTKRVNKKLKRAALRSALSDRAGSGSIIVIDGLGFDAPKTKSAIALLDAVELSATKRVLLVTSHRDAAVEKSFANLAAVHVLCVDQLNTYDVLVSDTVVFDQAALELIGTGRRSDTPETASTEEVPA